jgi:hypothetical protein
VRGIAGDLLQFDTGINIPNKRFGIANNWWDLRNDNGDEVSSGTYWLKVHADLVHEDTGDVESVAFFRKFILVR